METIYYKPDEVWNELHQIQETQILTIAESKFGDLGAYTDDDGKMFFIVVTNYCQPIEEQITDEDQCEWLCKELLADYIKEIDKDSTEYEISEREEELDAYVSDFIIAATGKLFFPEDNEEITEKIKNHFLEYLYKECGLDPYRPMILIDEETGSEIYTEYPYKYLI